jgi:hypothetical protein
MAASFQTAKDHAGGTAQARRLHEWTRNFIGDRECLPINIYGTWNSSVLDDEDFTSELQLHLQSIGKYVRAMDIVHYVDRPDVKGQLQQTADDTLSATKMPKFLPKHGNKWDGKDWGDGRKPKNWGVETLVVDKNGRLVHGEDGSVMKNNVCMQDGKFADGSPQSLYYPEGHKHTVIL